MKMRAASVLLGLFVLCADEVFAAEPCIDLFTVALRGFDKNSEGNRSVLEFYQRGQEGKVSFFDMSPSDQPGRPAPPALHKLRYMGGQGNPGRLAGKIEIGCQAKGTVIFYGLYEKWKNEGDRSGKLPLCQGDIVSIDQRDCPITSVVFQGLR
jgi:hypothetical protein